MLFTILISIKAKCYIIQNLIVCSISLQNFRYINISIIPPTEKYIWYCMRLLNLLFKGNLKVSPNLILRDIWDDFDSTLLTDENHSTPHSTFIVKRLVEWIYAFAVKQYIHILPLAKSYLKKHLFHMPDWISTINCILVDALLPTSFFLFI